MITRRSFLKALAGLPLISALPKLKEVLVPFVQTEQPKPVSYTITTSGGEARYIQMLKGNGVKVGQWVGLDEMGAVKPYDTSKPDNPIGIVVGGPDENGRVQVMIRGGFFTR